jgi:hypothetical protein
MTTFTARDLHDAGHDAQRHYNEQLTDEQLTAIHDIKYRHGFTDATWTDVVISANSWRFMPTREMNDCCREVRTYMYAIPHVNNPPININYTTELIHQAVVRNVLQYHDRTGRPFKYRINPRS